MNTPLWMPGGYAGCLVTSTLVVLTSVLIFAVAVAAAVTVVWLYNHFAL